MLLHVEVYVNVVASCVNLSENSRTLSMNIRLMRYLKVIVMISLNNILKKSKTNWTCPGVEPGTSPAQSENHATRPTGQHLCFLGA